MPVSGGGAGGNSRVSGLVIVASPIRQAQPCALNSRTTVYPAAAPSGSVVLNSATKHANVTIDGTGLTMQAASFDGNTQLARATAAASSTKFVCEVTYNSGSTSAFVGDWVFGFDDGTPNLAVTDSPIPGKDNALGISMDAWRNGSSAAGGIETYKNTGSVVLSDYTKSWRENGDVDQWRIDTVAGTAELVNSRLGSLGTMTGLSLGTLYAVIGSAANDNNLTANFTGPFVITPPAGYAAYDPGGAAPASYSMVASSAAFTLAGSAVALTAARTLAAASGSFVLTGSAMTPRVGMPAASGAFVLSGTAVALMAARRLSAASAAFVLSGTAVSLRKGFSMPAASGSFTLTGTAVALKVGRRLSAASAAYVLSGTAVTLKKGFTFAAASGSFTLSGSAVNFRRGLRFIAGSGAFALSGTAVTLIKGGARMIAAPGSFALSGSSVSFGFTHVMQASSGTFSLAGSTVSLWHGVSFGMIAGAGHFSFYGYPAVIKVAALPFFPDNVPASIGLSVPPVRLPVEVTAAALPTPIGVAGAAAVPPPDAFSVKAAPAPPVSWES